MRLRSRRLKQRIKTNYTNYTNRTDYKQMKVTLIFHFSLFTLHFAEGDCNHGLNG